MLLFRFNDKDGVVLHRDAVKLEPVLGKLSEQDLFFIILTQDYYSPYQQLSEIQRNLSACRRCYDNDQWQKNLKRLEKPVEKYRSLQFDIRRETIKNYQMKITLMNAQLMATDNYKDISDIQKSIDYLTKAMTSLEHALIMREQEEAVYDDSESFLEKFMANARMAKDHKRIIDNQKNKKTKKFSEMED